MAESTARQKHRVAQVDADRKIGMCQKCGEVPLYYRRDRDRWICSIAKREYDRNRPSPSTRRKHLGYSSAQRELIGASETVIAALLEAQEHKCAICKVDVTRASPVDHCHRTGKIRGVLCLKCNSGLGFFGDEPEMLTRALAYLLEEERPGLQSR